MEHPNPTGSTSRIPRAVPKTQYESTYTHSHNDTDDGPRDLDVHEQQGLKDTQRLLTTPKERDAAIRNDPKAKETDDKVEALTGSGQNKEEIYGIASKVMEKITLESNGDARKMQELLMEAQRNPEAFYNKYFGSAEKERVRALANDIDKKGTAVRPRK